MEVVWPTRSFMLLDIQISPMRGVFTAIAPLNKLSVPFPSVLLLQLWNSQTVSSGDIPEVLWADIPLYPFSSWLSSEWILCNFPIPSPYLLTDPVGY